MRHGNMRRRWRTCWHRLVVIGGAFRSGRGSGKRTKMMNTKTPEFVAGSDLAEHPEQLEPTQRRGGESPPSYYNDAEGSLAHAWGLMARGVKDRRSTFHTPTVGTVGADGHPALRTMVLRACDVSARSLRFHTDIRSRKPQELAADGRIAVHAYDAKSKLQLRLSGTGHIHNQDELTAAAWAASQPQSRKCYAQPVGSSQAMNAPEISAPELVDSVAYENFAALVITVTELEWLYLAARGHRRIVFRWQSEAWAAQWLAP